MSYRLLSRKRCFISQERFLTVSPSSVNSIFNPSYVNDLYPRSPVQRQGHIDDARSTNYGVVRLELIEHLYERMYDQRRELGPDERRWPHRILGGHGVERVDASPDGQGIKLHVRLDESVDQRGAEERTQAQDQDQVLDVDLVIAATGYRRRAHVDLLRDLWHLLPGETPRQQQRHPKEGPPADRWGVQTQDANGGRTTKRVLEVSRDYRVRFEPGSFAPGSGVYLQGCCEGTHGVSIVSSMCLCSSWAN